MTTGSSRSLAEEAYAVLRRAIMDGECLPMARLGPAELARRTGLGTTPIREALSRLAAEHMAVALPQRGFRVAPLSRAELSDLMERRLGFERDAIGASMRLDAPEWRKGVDEALTALLVTAPPRPGQRSADFADWTHAHDAFHAALMAGADLPWLRRFHRLTLDQLERYRAAMLRLRAGAAADGIDDRLARLLGHDEHEALAKAALGRDRIRLEMLLDRHMREAGAVFAALFAEAQDAAA